MERDLRKSNLLLKCANSTGKQSFTAARTYDQRRIQRLYFQLHSMKSVRSKFSDVANELPSAFFPNPSYCEAHIEWCSKQAGHQNLYVPSNSLLSWETKFWIVQTIWDQWNTNHLSSTSCPSEISAIILLWLSFSGLNWVVKGNITESPKHTWAARGCARRHSI